MKIPHWLTQSKRVFLAGWFLFLVILVTGALPVQAQQPAPWNWQFGPPFDWKTNAVASDSVGNVYVTGKVSGSFQPGNFPYPNPLGNSDAYLAKLNSSGNLVYLTYLGGQDNDQALALAVQDGGVVAVTGTTTSSDFPVTPQASSSGTNFVTALNTSTGQILYSARFGQNIVASTSSLIFKETTLVCAFGSQDQSILVKADFENGIISESTHLRSDQVTKVVQINTLVYLISGNLNTKTGEVTAWELSAFPQGPTEGTTVVQCFPQTLATTTDQNWILVGGVSPGLNKNARPVFAIDPNSGDDDGVIIPIPPIIRGKRPIKTAFYAQPAVATQITFDRPVTSIVVDGDQFYAAGEQNGLEGIIWEGSLNGNYLPLTQNLTSGVRSLGMTSDSLVFCDTSATAYAMLKP